MFVLNLSIADIVITLLIDPFNAVGKFHPASSPAVLVLVGMQLKNCSLVRCTTGKEYRAMQLALWTFDFLPGAAAGRHILMHDFTLCNFIASFCAPSCLSSMWNMCAISLNRFVRLRVSARHERVVDISEHAREPQLLRAAGRSVITPAFVWSASLGGSGMTSGKQQQYLECHLQKLTTQKQVWSYYDRLRGTESYAR